MTKSNLRIYNFKLYQILIMSIPNRHTFKLDDLVNIIFNTILQQDLIVSM